LPSTPSILSHVWYVGAGVVTVTPEVEDLISPCERQQVAAVQLKFLPQCYDVRVLPVGAV